MRNDPAATVTVLDHSLARHWLSILRDRTTTANRFRRYTLKLARMLINSAVADLPLDETTISTPLARTSGFQPAAQVVFVPVLRAGLAMLRAGEEIFPAASVGFIGLARDEHTAVAQEYYRNLPENIDTAKVLILDPMLATGGSLIDTIDAVKDRGATDITAVCIVAAPEGIAAVAASHDDVKIITAAIDDHLDDNKFIVPGLGDFGDRYFAT